MLKWIALMFMLIDHFAYIMFEFIPYEVYLPMRVIGRISFPIFVYYVVLGVGRTSKLKTYMTRLFLFALLAEVVIRSLGLFSNPYLNVIFSLLVYAVIYVLYENKLGKLKVNSTIRFATIILLIMLLPYVEYGYSGFLVFASLYFVHKKIPEGVQHLYAAVLISLSFLPEILFAGGWQIQLLAGLSGLLMFNQKLDGRIFSPRVEKWTFYWAYSIQWLFFGALYYYMIS